MVYDNKKLYSELLELLKLCMEKDICPVCGRDLRPVRDCENCNIDHLGSKCYRNGKHSNECLLVKHIALVEIEIYLRRNDV